MKKIVLILCILLCCSSACYADIQVDLSSTTEKYDVDSNVVWSGKEWITTKYPPEISGDGESFTLVDGSKEIENEVLSRTVTYFWTGSDYLIYYPIIQHTYQAETLDKYLYRISEDMKTIVDKYTIPDKAWINNIVYHDGKYYILTENVVSKTDGTVNSRVYGESCYNFCLYESTDFYDWKKVELPFELAKYDKRPSLYNINGNIAIINYESGGTGLVADGEVYTNLKVKNFGIMQKDKVYEVKFENFDGKQIDVLGEYIYSELYDEENDKEQVAFSNDGIYWVNLSLSNQRNILKVYEKNGSIVIKSLSDRKAEFDIIDKEELNLQLSNSLSSANTYVRLNDTILGFSQPPVMESDRTLVPMRFLFEQMGADVDWNDETQTATAKISARGGGGERNGAGENTVTFSIDNTTAYVNGAETTMDVPARLINDQTFVPLRFLSENLGYNVEWDEANNTAIITTE